MAENSGIEWCKHTWSPWRGCTKVSDGCKHCYADATAKRNSQVLGVWGPNGSRTVNADWKTPLRWNRQAAAAGERWRIFPSMCDPFEDWQGTMMNVSGKELLASPVLTGVNAAWPLTMDHVRRRFFDLIDATPHLDWLLLTKRPENIGPMLWDTHDTQAIAASSLPPNVWLGTSVENQATADERIPHLLQVPAAVRFLSCEPLLGPVDLTPWLPPAYTQDPAAFRELSPSIDWVIVGGESGPHARPPHPDWFRSVRDQCKAAVVPFFLKQWGEWLPFSQSGLPSFSPRIPDWPDAIREEKRRECWGDGRPWCYAPGDATEVLIRVGKKRAGRLLDGREWSEFPAEVRA